MEEDAEPEMAAVTASAAAGGPTVSASQASIPWVEKYRPVLIQDVVGNEEAVQRLRIIARDGNLPNIILTGPPGTGKTSSICCLARELLGDQYKAGVMELNASDNRNLDVVRQKIKMFAQKKVTLPPGRQKIVILDEADSMMPAAQAALRRTMEIYSTTTRFALACNHSNKIIEPIQSRCAILRFTKLRDQDVLERVMHVIEKEGVPHAEDGLESILYAADGDLRDALNALQATYFGFGIVTADGVFKVCNQPHPALVHQVLEHCLERNYTQAQKALNVLWSKGYPASDVITTFFKVVQGKEMNEAIHLAWIKAIAVSHMRIVEGVASRLQLSGLIARLCQAVPPPMTTTPA